MTHILKHAAIALTAMALVLGMLVVRPVPVQARTHNACSIEYGVRDKKIKEGKAVVVMGKLKKRKESGHVFWTLLDDSGTCEIMIQEGSRTDAEAEKCGDGAKVTIIGKILIPFVFPDVDPARISCN